MVKSEFRKVVKSDWIQDLTTFEKWSNLTAPSSNARVEFDNWNGNTRVVNLQEEDEGNGFDKEEVEPLN